MVNKSMVVCGLIAALIQVYGCATVDPQQDYVRVEQHVGGATGIDRLYRPEDDAIVAEVVARLVNEGITASEAAQISLLNNPSLQAAFFDVGMARADVVQAGLLSNPFLGITAKFPDGGGLASIEASVAQNIAELWQIPIRTRSAERSLDRAILDLARMAAHLAADAKTAYYRAVGADERYRIERENLTVSRNLLELAIARQQAGAAAELDVNLSRSLVVDAEIEVERARLAAADSRRALATTLGLVADAGSLSLVDALPDDYPEMADPQSLVELARTQRLDIRAAAKAVSTAEASLEEERRRVFPSVEMGIEFESEARRSQGGRDFLADTARASIANGALAAPGIQPRSERHGEGGHETVIGPSLGIEIPIFDQNQAQIAKATFALERARKTAEALDRAMTQDVRGAVDRASTAWRMMQLYRDRSLPLADKNLDLSREAYRAGRTSFLSVLEAQRFFLETRSGYVSASEAAATAIPDLERAIGLPLSSIMGEPAPGEQPPDPNTEEGTKP